MEPGKRCFVASLENLPAASDFVEECADRFGLAAGKRFGLLLALEEAFVNICNHAYSGGIGETVISCRGDGDLFVLEISDQGIPFDVLSLPEPDLTCDITERPIGGLGIHFIRQMSDHAAYRRESGSNILRLEFKNPVPG